MPVPKHLEEKFKEELAHIDRYLLRTDPSPVVRLNRHPDFRKDRPGPEEGETCAILALPSRSPASER